MTSMDAPPATKLVTLDIEGDQASITLTRAEKYNALNVAMIQELIALFEWTAERSAGRQDKLHDAQGGLFCEFSCCEEKGSTSVQGPTST